MEGIVNLLTIVFKGISDTFVSILTEKLISPIINRYFSDKEKSIVVYTSYTSLQISTPGIYCYAKLLGERLKNLRENLLEIDIKTMSDIYGFNEVSQLERYERGEEEYSSVAIDILVNVFFIRKEFIEQGIEPVFQSFEWNSEWNSRSNIKNYLGQGFQPYFLLSPNFQKDSGSCYLVFRKNKSINEREISQVICSDSEDYFLPVNSFESSGSEGRCIQNLISAMLSLNLYPDDFSRTSIEPFNSQQIYISFLKVNSQDWERLEKGCYYFKGVCPGKPGLDITKAREIFKNWFMHIHNNHL